MTLLVAKIGETHYLKGELDESADFDALGLKAPVRFNLAQLKAMNSIGVGMLASMASEVGYENITYEQVPEIFVDAANSVASILGWGKNKSRVESMLVPHQCPQCKHRQAPLIQTVDIRTAGRDIDLPEVSCDKCGKPTSLDVDPDEFFGFLSE